MNLWIRMGDNSDYENFGADLFDLVDSLKEYNLGKFLFWRINGGFETENFQGGNYISIFWGNNNAQFEEEITKFQREAIEVAIKNKFNYT